MFFFYVGGTVTNCQSFYRLNEIVFLCRRDRYQPPVILSSKKSIFYVRRTVTCHQQFYRVIKKLFFCVGGTVTHQQILQKVPFFVSARLCHSPPMNLLSEKKLFFVAGTVTHHQKISIWKINYFLCRCDCHTTRKIYLTKYTTFCVGPTLISPGKSI